MTISHQGDRVVGANEVHEHSHLQSSQNSGGNYKHHQQQLYWTVPHCFGLYWTKH